MEKIKTKIVCWRPQNEGVDDHLLTILFQGHVTEGRANWIPGLYQTFIFWSPNNLINGIDGGVMAPGFSCHDGCPSLSGKIYFLILHQ